MKVLIEAPFTINDDTKNAIEEKMGKLNTFSSKITQTEVYFKNGDGNEPDSILAEVQVHVPGAPVFASASSHQFMDALTAATTKVERQLRKRHDKMVSHH